MTTLKSERKYSSYICGKCKGDIIFERNKGRPRVCPECGYGHGSRDVNDVPSIVRLNLKNLSTSDDYVLGKLEKTTISSR